MNTVGDFYELRTLVPASGGFRAEAVMRPDHPVYAGHFPERPVVPGVFTLAMVRDCAAAVLGRPAGYEAVRECKFLSVLLPGDVVTLEFMLDGQLKLAGTVRRGTDVILKLKAVLR